MILTGENQNRTKTCSIDLTWTGPSLFMNNAMLVACFVKSFVPDGMVNCVWNVMAHTQKPDFVFQWNERVLKSAGVLVQSTTGSRGVHISGSNAGYTMFQGCVKGTGYTLHSSVSPSLPRLCITVCHHISSALYQILEILFWLSGGCIRQKQRFM